MKQKRIILSLLLVMFSVTFYFTSKYIGASWQSKFVYQNSSAPLDIKDGRTLYNLDLILNTDEKKISCGEKVQFKNHYKSGLKELVFHLYADSYNSAETKPSIGGVAPRLTPEEIGDIKIGSVKINGKKVKFTEDKQILKIRLDKELKSGETAEIFIEFTLKIPMGKDRLGHFQEQYSLTNWYPILAIYDEKSSAWDENPFHPVGESNYSDSSNYKAVVTVPKGMMVVTTGVRVSQKSDSNMDKLYFEAENNRDFVLFMSKDYKVVSKEIDGIKVNSYYLREESTAKRMLSLASEALNFFNKAYGKYPYPEYDVVESYLQGGAMEYPTVTQMGPYSRLNEVYKENELTFFDEAVVHETAHQWWYSTVGNNEFAEPVLDETFTSYSTALFFENLYGEYSPLAIKSTFLRLPIAGSAPIYRSTDKFTWQDFGRVVYKLGPVVLEDLRQKAGKDKFMDVFRTYYDRYKFKNATFEDFLGIVREICGSEMSEYVRTSFTSKNYSMDKMIISQEEMRKIQERRSK